jgi:hypothetical protein
MPAQPTVQQPVKVAALANKADVCWQDWAGSGNPLPAPYFLSGALASAPTGEDRGWQQTATLAIFAHRQIAVFDHAVQLGKVFG